MSNRTMTDLSVMQERWEGLLEDMRQVGIDALLMYSTDRIFSSYLRYVSDMPTSLYPMAGLFSEKGISLVGHGVDGVPLFPPPPENLEKNSYAFHSGGVATHDFIIDQIGVPACSTTNYDTKIWARAVTSLVKKYGYKKIGLVGTNTIPIEFISLLENEIKDIEIVDASVLVDVRKSVKSSYEIEQAKHCAATIDELMIAAKGFVRPGISLREVGRKLRAMADGLDCMDLNIMLGKHPTMPMFSEWIYTDEDPILPSDCVEIMVEVSDSQGFWGECARVYSLDSKPQGLIDAVERACKLQDYVAAMLIPGTDPSIVYESYCKKLKSLGYPEERRFFCHGQGYDVVEAPFIRPENHMLLEANSIVALHPSIYNPQEGFGCFICDNYILTERGAERLNKVPREIFQAIY